MSLTHQIARRIFPKEQSELGKHARDVQTVFDKIPVQEHRVIVQPYTEPMTIGGLSEEPFCIELVRVADTSNANTVVTASTSLVHFTWLPSKGGAVIDKISGMTVATAPRPKLRFYFRITYKME